MSIKKLFSFTILIVVSLITSGCLQVNTGQNQNQIPNGGFFVSADKGVNWEQRTSILSTAEPKNFSLEMVSSFTVDPSNTATLYYGTVGKGLLYSIDKGLSWQVAYDVGPGTVAGVAIDPKDKCKVYVAIGSTLHKTEDCNRTWETVFTDPAAKNTISGVEVDPVNSKNIYISLTRGDLVKSSDEGKSWQTIHRFQDTLRKFKIDPNDARRMYADLAVKGLQISNDAGVTWESQQAAFIENKIPGIIVSIALVKEDPNLVYVATPSGIMRSRDRAKTWELLTLIPPQKNAFVTSIAVNPKDTKEIYYISGNTFYKSVDEGVNWTPRPLPSNRKAEIIEVDAYDPNIIFLGLGA